MFTINTRTQSFRTYLVIIPLHFEFFVIFQMVGHRCIGNAEIIKFFYEHQERENDFD